MNKKLTSIFISSLIYLLSSCSLNNAQTGSFVMSVDFTQYKNFKIKAIPQDTFLILVRVNGNGIDALRPIAFELTKENNTRLISSIPTGDKTIKVSAIDAQGQLLAQGESQINIMANRINRTEVILSEVKAPQVEEECIIKFPSSEIVSETLKKSLESAGCKVETI